MEATRGKNKDQAKFSDQNLAISQTLPMFVPTNILEGGHSSLNPAGFFYARNDKRFCTPVANCNGMPALEVLVNGKGRTVFLFSACNKPFSEMTNTEKMGLSGKHSTHTLSHHPLMHTAKKGRKRAYKPLFEAEKNAKNKAYSYIITSGQLEDFASYSRITSGMDHHAICVGAIVAKHFSLTSKNAKK